MAAGLTEWNPAAVTWNCDVRRRYRLTGSDGDIQSSAFANDAQQNRFGLRVAHGLFEFAAGGYGLMVDFGHDVACADSGVSSGAVRIHLRDDYALGFFAEMQLLASGGAERLDLEAL